MTEDIDTTDVTDNAKDTGATDGADTGWKPPASQADLDRIITERVARERAKYADHADLKKKAAEFDKLSAAQQTELEKAVNAARAETENAVRSEVMRDRVLDRVEALAAKDFADAEDARLRLASRVEEFIADGKIDSDAIKAALGTLLTDKPHLAVPSDRRPRGDVDQGARGNPVTTTDPAKLAAMVPRNSF